MLTKRIIPCLDVKDGRTVKGTNFENLRDAGDLVELAKLYSDEGADELVFLDISASEEGRKTLLDMVERVAAATQIPFTVGGGVGSVDDVIRLLSAGADKVSLNTSIVQDPELLTSVSRRLGSQSVVAAIDAKQTNGTWTVWTHGGKQETTLDAIVWAREVAQRGAGELLVTSMNRDGTKSGYDLALIHEVSTRVPVPLIASGGAGNPEHFRNALTSGADAVLAASLFHYRDMSIRELKEYLQQEGIPVRL